MAQSDGFGAGLQRMALRLTGENSGELIYHKFAVNPNNYKETHPQRTTTFKTRTATVVEDFGADLTQITFSGTTGHKKDSKGFSGADRLGELKLLLSSYGESAQRVDDVNTETYELTFYNLTDGGSYIVHLDPEGFVIERSAERPILFDYTINLTVLRKASDPVIRDEAELGNSTTSDAVNPNGNTPVYSNSVDSMRGETE